MPPQGLHRLEVTLVKLANKVLHTVASVQWLKEGQVNCVLNTRYHVYVCVCVGIIQSQSQFLCSYFIGVLHVY